MFGFEKVEKRFNYGLFIDTVANIPFADRCKAVDTIFSHPGAESIIDQKYGEGSYKRILENPALKNKAYVGIAESLLTVLTGGPALNSQQREIVVDYLRKQDELEGLAEMKRAKIPRDKGKLVILYHAAKNAITIAKYSHDIHTKALDNLILLEDKKK